MTQATVAAALQRGASPEGEAATLQDVLSFEQQIRASGASLVVMPDALPFDEIDPARIAHARQVLPVLENRRFAKPPLQQGFSLTGCN